MATPKPSITYYHRGQVERGVNYRWHEAYSSESPDGNVLYPWMTRNECLADARAQGCKAVFKREP